MTRKLSIAVTGGPCAGKTALINILALHFNKDLSPVEEAASFLFRAGFPRKNEAEHKRCEQRAIYHIQQELENIAQLDHGTCGILCDRGSLDSLAYWPGTASNFFTEIKSSIGFELSRYDWVIHIDSAPPVELGINHIRTENVEEILVLNQKIKEAWSSHPQRILLPTNIDFEAKVQLAVRVVDRIIKDHKRSLSQQPTLESKFFDFVF